MQPLVTGQRLFESHVVAKQDIKTDCRHFFSTEGNVLVEIFYRRATRDRFFEADRSCNYRSAANLVNVPKTDNWKKLSFLLIGS